MYRRFLALAVPMLALISFIALVTPVSGQSSGTETGHRQVSVEPTPWVTQIYRERGILLEPRPWSVQTSIKVEKG